MENLKQKLEKYLGKPTEDAFKELEKIPFALEVMAMKKKHKYFQPRHWIELYTNSFDSCLGLDDQNWLRELALDEMRDLKLSIQKWTDLIKNPRCMDSMKKVIREQVEKLEMTFEEWQEVFEGEGPFCQIAGRKMFEALK